MSLNPLHIALQGLGASVLSVAMQGFVLVADSSADGPHTVQAVAVMGSMMCRR